MKRTKLRLMAPFDFEAACRSKTFQKLRVRFRDDSVPTPPFDLQVQIYRRRSERSYWAGRTETGTTFRVKYYEGRISPVIVFDGSTDELKDQAHHVGHSGRGSRLITVMPGGFVGPSGTYYPSSLHFIHGLGIAEG